jgi:proline dehydrogenase
VCISTGGSIRSIMAYLSRYNVTLASLQCHTRHLVSRLIVRGSEVATAAGAAVAVAPQSMTCHRRHLTTLSISKSSSSGKQPRTMSHTNTHLPHLTSCSNLSDSRPLSSTMTMTMCGLHTNSCVLSRTTLNSTASTKPTRVVPIQSTINDFKQDPTGIPVHVEETLVEETNKDMTEVDFSDAERAFKFRTTGEIIRSLFVFRMCRNAWLVKNSAALLAGIRKIFGDTIPMWVIKHTFFGHFCAGEDAQDIRPMINRLGDHGVGSILDYAAEADLDPDPVVARDTEATGRVFPDDIGEAECDKNVEVFLQCIDATAQFKDGFAAVKVTALGRPALLERMSQVLAQTRKLFSKFDRDGSSDISYDEFSTTLDELGVDVEEKAKRELFSSFDKSGDGKIDYLEWIEYLRPERLQTRFIFSKQHRKESGDVILPCLEDNELDQLIRMLNRLRTIAAAAAEKRVRLLIDAEQTYFQPAISHAVMNLQREFNKDFPSIFNTYQCYLRESFDQMKLDVERAKREKFWFATKLVRGAYMISERARAKEMGYEDPIWPDIVATHKCYHDCVEFLLHRMHRSNVMVASHNEETMRFATNVMKTLKIPRKGGGVFFAQLLGMSDHLSMTLGKLNWAAYKYVPYGPVSYVIPYLLRRAEENFDALGGGATQHERHLLWIELLRRLGFRKSSTNA